MLVIVFYVTISRENEIASRAGMKMVSGMKF